MRLASLEIADWPPFAPARVSFDAHVNLFVGGNGAGKSRLLEGLAHACGALNGSAEGQGPRPHFAVEFTPSPRRARPAIPCTGGAELSALLAKHHTPVVLIPSHRSGARAAELAALRGPARAVARRIAEEILGEYMPLSENRAGNNSPVPACGGADALLAWLEPCVAAFRPGRGARPAPAGILFLEEPELHLHPAAHARVLPALAHAFPGVQVFAGSHAPLLAAGLRSGQLHALRRSAHGSVEIRTLPVDLGGWSADEILRSIMETPAATDLETIGLLRELNRLAVLDQPSGADRRRQAAVRADLAERLVGPTALRTLQTALGARAAGPSLAAPAPVRKDRRCTT